MHFIFGDTVDFTRLTWEAFAAFIAVVAAAIVGWRQVGIQKRQVAIADLEARSMLWKERLDVYDATRAYLSHIVTKGSVPGRKTLPGQLGGRPSVAPEIADAFYTALDRSQFLFQPEVHKALDTLWRKAEELATIRGSADIMYEPTKTPMAARAAALRKELVDLHSDVAAIFGDELRLAHATESARGRDFFRASLTR